MNVPSCAPASCVCRSRRRAPTAVPPRTLHVRTANPHDAASPTLISATGQIARALDLPLDDGAATVLIPHAPGLVLAWIDRPGEEAQDLWGQAALPVETTLGPPAVVPLTGAVQTMRFGPPEPLMLHVRTSTPVVTLAQARRRTAGGRGTSHRHRA